MSLAILFHFLCAQHVWTLIYPSSGACDYSAELPHWSYCSWFDVCWSFGHNSNPTIPKLQHTSNQEQYDQCGNSSE